MAARPRVPEAFVAWLWTQEVGATLTTTDGQRVQVVYPGRRYGSWGPDFHGALLAIGDRLTRGDVEIHVHGRDWTQHRHAGDPAYDDTVLHVVLEQGRSPLATLADGVAVPTVELSSGIPASAFPSLLARWTHEGSRPPVAAACLSGEEAIARLDRAGMERFRGKVARFEGDMACVSSVQALWAGLLESLGYAANVAPFRALADRVPAVEAEHLVTAGCGQLLEAILLGEAGLLPSQRGRLSYEDYAAAVERAWHASRRGPRSPLGWRWVGARPGNTPVRRVAAAAALIGDAARWPMERHVVAALAELPPRRAASALRALLARSGDSYWQLHGDLDRPLFRPLALIGEQRAADAVVNVVLPWAAALGRSQDTLWIEEAAERVYAAHPPLASNQITRHMALQILGSTRPSFRLAAQRQQGLIHIYRGWCDARDCAACPAGPEPGLGLTFRTM